MIAVFLFYNIATGIQSRLAFSDEFKHCNIITFDGKDWISLDFDRGGLITRRVNCRSGAQLLRNLRVMKNVSAIVSVSIDQRFNVSWKPWWVRSCNEICRYTAGIDLGFTFNPRHLYRKLLKYRHCKNYEMLSHWRRKHGISE